MALVVLLLAACSTEPDDRVWEISGPVFGTSYHINVVLPADTAPDTLDTLAAGIDTVLEDVDASMSTWRKDSELSRFNARADQSRWFEISQPLYEVLATAQSVSERSGGAFDITMGPLVNLWGFGPRGRPREVPEEDELAQVLAATGYHNLELDPERPAVRAAQPQTLDLSAIAKGYGVDAVARHLEAQGVKRYLVEIGGEIRVNGRKPDGTAWRLAIEEPIAKGRQINRIVALTSQAMATSGDYRNYYEAGGQRYSHTIDPFTGRPVAHRLASVTVIAESSMVADAWATAFSVLGYEESRALAVRENMAVYFIVRGRDGDDAFEAYHTPAFSSYLTN